MKLPAPVTKSDFAYRQIREAILEGNLSPGDRLRLSELAGRFEVSEIPIREALRMLQRDGLVEFANHRGAVVSNISQQELFELISVRTHLEVLAVCEAIPFHTEKSLCELDKLAARMEQETNSKRFSQANHDFHELLIDPCPNRFLKAEIKELWDRVWKRWSKSLFEIFPDRKKLAAKEHIEIVAAIRSGDINQVEWAMKNHRSETIKHWAKLCE